MSAKISEAGASANAKADPSPAAKDSNVLQKFKNIVTSIIQGPGKLIAFIAKEKPMIEEDVRKTAESVAEVAKQVEESAIMVEKASEIVAKEAKATEELAMKVEKTMEAAENKASSTDTKKSSEAPLPAASTTSVNATKASTTMT